MQFIQIATEDEGQNNAEGQTPENADASQVDLDPNNTQNAIDAVNNQDSTEPAKQLQVANYKQELAILQQQKENSVSEDDLTGGNADGGEGGTEGETPTDDGEADNGGEGDGEEDPAPENDEDNGEDNEGDELSESEDTDPVNTDAEMGQEAPDKDPVQTATEQYMVEGQRMVNAAIESIFVMGKYHSFLERRSQLGGISPATAKVINNVFERHIEVCGYTQKTPMPAMESYGSYSGSVNSTQELKVAIEGFLETVWDAIKKFFKSIWTWIMDMLTTKQPTSTTPSDKPTRDKAVKELEKRNADLEKQLAGIDRAREKDAERKSEAELERLRREAKEARARMSRKVASTLFRTSDKGSFSEILNNARTLQTTCMGAVKHSQELSKHIAIAAGRAIQGQMVPPSAVAVTKNQVPGVQINQLNRAEGKNVTLEAITEEILGGIGVRFIFAGTDVDKITKTIGIPRTYQELGQQGFKVVGVKEKTGFPVNLPELDKNELQDMRAIVTEVASTYAAMDSIQAVVKQLAEYVKKNSEGSQPTAWNNLDRQSVAALQAQLNFVGMIETSLVAGYKSLNDQVNNFKNSYLQLTAYFL